MQCMYAPYSTEMNGAVLPLLHAWLGMFCIIYGTGAYLFLLRPSIKQEKNYISLERSTVIMLYHLCGI